MPVKKSNSKDKMSPIEKLFSGRVGPLPIDNDQHSPDVRPEHINAGTRSSELDANSEHFDPVKAQIFKDHPTLTEQVYQDLLAEM